MGGSKHKPWAQCCRPGPGLPEMGEETQLSRKERKKKGFRKYSSVRNCFKEQFSSFSTFLKYCSSIIVTVCSSGRAMK